MMTIEAIRCPQCGVTLQVNASLRSFYCTHCNTKLLINVSNQGAVFLSILDENKYYTGTTAKRSALARLKEQMQLLIKDRDAQRRELLGSFSAEKAKMYKAASIGSRASLLNRPQELVDKERALKNKYDQLILDLETKITACAQQISLLSGELARITPKA
ncbi:MAG: Rcat domain-containing protein [Anaerolineae bacterium]